MNAVVDGRSVWIAGGFKDGYPGKAISPAGTWSQLGTLPAPLIGPAARIIDGRLVVAGGAPRGFDPLSAVWAQPLSQ